MNRFLIIGASGLIGQYALRILRENAVGTFHRREFSGGVHFDMVADDVDGLLARVGRDFSHALVLGGNSNIDSCAADPAASNRVNVYGVIRTVDGLASRGIVPIFASSDAVYDGTHGMWSEDDAVVSILTYGWQKLAVERHLAGLRTSWIAVRICKVLDPELMPHGVIGPWIDALLERQLIRCATDQRFTPVGVEDVVGAMVRLAGAGVSGVYNLGGKDRVRRIDLLAATIAAVRQYAPVDPVVEECSIRDFPFLEARPFDTSVSIEKLRRVIRYEPESLDSLCRRAAAEYFRRRGGTPKA